MNDQGFGVAHIGQQTGQLHIIHKGPAGRATALYAKGQHGAEQPLAQIFFGPFMRGMGLQTGIPDPLHRRMRFQPARQFQGVLAMAFDAQGERFQPL